MTRENDKLFNSLREVFDMGAKFSGITVSDKAIAKHDFIRSALADLTEYAEKLGVEL